MAKTRARRTKQSRRHALSCTAIAASPRMGRATRLLLAVGATVSFAWHVSDAIVDLASLRETEHASGELKHTRLLLAVGARHRRPFAMMPHGGGERKGPVIRPPLAPYERWVLFASDLEA
jgi:hypothetical protein